MHPNKRRRNAEKDDHGDIKKNKVHCTSVQTNVQRSSATHLDDLSNELLYEVFEYFNTDELYESFFDLNTRFRNLCLRSSLPITIHNSFLSKSAFQRFHTHLIILNKHRIQSLHLSNPCILDFFSSTTEDISACTQLQTLFVDKIDSQHLQNVLASVSTLSHLSSLTIPIGLGSDIGTLWNQIMQLRVLKYLQITIEDMVYFNVSLMSTHTPSSVEHLVIKGKLDHNLIDSILSYVPLLRRLSVDYLYGFYTHGTRLLSSLVRHLTHVSLVMAELSFEQFEILVKAYFSQVKVLRITSRCDTAYIMAKQWQTLIENYIPHLQIFDIHYVYDWYKRNNFRRTLPSPSVFEEFTSPFWTERHWFFAHSGTAVESFHVIFYSDQPYRRKSYTLTDESKSLRSACADKIELPIVTHVIVPDEKMIETSPKYFPNAVELTISDQRIDRSRRSATASVDSILPFKQLTKLTVEYYHRAFSKVVELLFTAPHVRTLVLKHVSIVEIDYVSLLRSERFRFVSDHNKIRDLTVSFDYSLEDIQLFMRLCPKLQRLTLGASTSCTEGAMQFLLAQTKKSTCHLSSISISVMDTSVSDKLRALVESAGLVHNYTIKVIGRAFYFWR